MPWVEINDFTPGIRQVPSPSHPLGAAAEGTYNCYADPTGSLRPLPGRSDVHALGGLTEDDNLASPEYFVGGIACMDPVFTSGDTVPGVNQRNTDIWVGIESWSNDQKRRRRIYRLLWHRENPIWHNVHTLTTSSTFNPESRPERCHFVTGRTNNPDPDQVGPVSMAWCYGDYARHFPDESDPGSNDTVRLPGDSEPLVLTTTMIGHQGRLVIFPLSVTQLGQVDGKPIVSTTNESFYWTEPNNWRVRSEELDDKGYFNNIAGYENPTGYGAVASLTANELLLIKARGGALVVDGSLDDFRARTLPNVRSTGQSLDYGTSTPLGFMYLADSSGAWLWEGGDTSRFMSPQLYPDFYRPFPTDSLRNPAGYGFGHTQSTQWGEFVALPNNWIFDTNTGGWWRLDDPTRWNIHKATVDWKGRWLFTTQSGFPPGGQVPIIRGYDMQVPAENYRWISHPLVLPGSHSHQSSIDRVIVTASGQGTVRVSLSSADNPTESASQKIHVNDPNRATVHRLDLRRAGSNVQLHLEVFGDPDSPTHVAPTVHKIAVLVNEHNELGASHVQ